MHSQYLCRYNISKNVEILIPQYWCSKLKNERNTGSVEHQKYWTKYKWSYKLQRLGEVFEYKEDGKCF